MKALQQRIGSFIEEMKTREKLAEVKDEKVHDIPLEY